MPPLDQLTARLRNERYTLYVGRRGRSLVSIACNIRPEMKNATRLPLRRTLRAILITDVTGVETELEVVVLQAKLLQRSFLYRV